MTATDIINFYNLNYTKGVVYCFEHNKCSAKLDKKYSDMVYEVCNFSDGLLARRDAEAALVLSCVN